MNSTARVCHAAAAAAQWLALVLLSNAPMQVAVADEPPPAVIDSGTIIRSLKPANNVSTRGLEIQAAGADTAAGGGSGKITLDIRFGNDSDRLTRATETQLTALGSALSSPELASARFLIAGHTSATGAAEHNQRLSEARARAVRTYLIEHFHLGARRIEATGYGSSRPLPNFAPNALQQRRVEIITLPNS
jgi:outer membrane protein OmpA-like peptidoglycan-associated protein